MLNVRNCTIKTLFEVIGKRRIYAFGAGIQPRSFIERNPICDLSKIIYKFVDNNDEKWGKNYELNGSKFPIISPHEMSGEIETGDVILITSRFYAEIIDLLDKNPCLDGIDCYILTYVERVREQIDSKEEQLIISRMEQEIQIPKTIHFCWFGGNPIPEKEQMCINSWKKMCPDYEIIQWTEENYDVHKNRYMGQAYDTKKWGFVVDFARLDLVTEYGGVYLDADVELIRPLDDLLKFKAFAGYESADYVAFGLGFGSIKHHKIMEANKELYEKVEFCKNDGTLNLTASPVLQTNRLKEFGFKPDGHFKMIEDMAILPPEFLCGMNVSTRMLELTKNTYAIHHYSASWMSDEERQWAKSNEDWVKRRIDNLQRIM